MRFVEFDKIQNNLFVDCEKMGASKGREYANSEDRFDNFNRLAQRLGIDRKQILLIYMTKHMDSIESFVKTGQTHSTEPIRGRIVDAITYLTLLAGMIEEDQQCSTVVGSTVLSPLNKFLEPKVAEGKEYTVPKLVDNSITDRQELGNEQQRKEDISKNSICAAGEKYEKSFPQKKKG